MPFIIHSLKLQSQAEALEKRLGKPCYIPGRDTPQDHGDNILPNNLAAMRAHGADGVYVIWDGASQGTLFDMGMAYALGYEIHPTMLVGGRGWTNYFNSKIGGTIGLA